jgi:hypothetical protein
LPFSEKKKSAKHGTFCGRKKCSEFRSEQFRRRENTLHFVILFLIIPGDKNAQNTILREKHSEAGISFRTIKRKKALWETHSEPVKDKEKHWDGLQKFARNNEIRSESIPQNFS